MIVEECRNLIGLLTTKVLLQAGLDVVIFGCSPLSATVSANEQSQAKVHIFGIKLLLSSSSGRDIIKFPTCSNTQRYMPFRRRLTLIVFLSLVTLYSRGQQYSFKATSPIVEATMQKAVVNAKKFITHTIPPDVYKEYFQLITSLSAVKSDYASYHYTPYMDDTISFVPGKYELRYLIKIGKDTLTDSFVIPVDSFGHVDVDTSNLHYILDDLKAYKKLLTGQYKFDFESVKRFINEKHIKDYSIVFMNSMSTLNSKNYKTLKVFKHYWYVTEYKKNGYRTTYTIDPDTGKVTIKNEKVRALS